MSDLHNWKASLDQCHQKHIGPPPPLQRRIAYLEAHRWAGRNRPPAPILARVQALLGHTWRRIRRQG